MSLSYVNKTYGLSLKRGMRVSIYSGKQGKILSASHNVRVLLDNGQRVYSHPSDVKVIEEDK